MYQQDSHAISVEFRIEAQLSILGWDSFSQWLDCFRSIYSIYKCVWYLNDRLVMVLYRTKNIASSSIPISSDFISLPSPSTSLP